MHLPNLAELHRSMTQSEISRAQFVWDIGRHGKQFNVIFLADMDPMVLLFGLVGGQFAFERDVSSDYRISAYLGGDLKAFMDALELTYDPLAPFSTKAIFTELASRIPTRAADTLPVSYRDIPRTREVEESHKIYFVGWQNNGKYRSASPENLSKTLLLLGSDAHARCRSANMSSCWSDEPLKAMDYYHPGHKRPR